MTQGCRLQMTQGVRGLPLLLMGPAIERADGGQHIHRQRHRRRPGRIEMCLQVLVQVKKNGRNAILTLRRDTESVRWCDTNAAGCKQGDL